MVTRYGHGLPLKRIEVVEAGHPVPDAAGSRAAQQILEMVRGLSTDDLGLCLVSGGGSALLTLPAPGISLEDKRAVTRALLTSGATISEMNCLRKHLSAIKGGRLGAAAAPARVVSLAISDVPGDDPAVIASGPTVPDPTTFAEARAILAKYAIEPPASVAARLAAGRDETPKPGDRRLATAEYRLIATPQRALEAAAAAARAAGLTPVILGDAIEGEAKDVALVHVGIARQAAAGRLIVGDRAPGLPLVLLSGGETTVTVRGQGHGGPAAEVPAGLLAVEKRSTWRCLRHSRHRHCDTDAHRTVPRNNAGAIVGPDSVTPASTCPCQSQSEARGERRLWRIRGARRSRGHRPDTHQRERFSCDPDHP